MQEFQTRVIEEKRQLDSKIKRLGNFLVSETFEGLLDLERDRLFRQYKTMTEYSGILSERIIYF